MASATATPSVNGETEAGPSRQREALLTRSMQRGGFGAKAGARRTAWLQVLDLEHLQERLPAIEEAEVQETTTKGQNGVVDAAPPLDSEGWQMATHDLDQSLCEDDEKRQGGATSNGGEDGGGLSNGADDDDDDDDNDSEWNVAISKRTRRRRRAMTLESDKGGGDRQGEMKPSSSGTATASTALSRDASSIGFHLIGTPAAGDNDDEADAAGDSLDTLKAQRKARKRLRKRQRQRGQSGSTNEDGNDDGDGDGGDLTSSIVHVASSPTVHKDEEQVALDVRRSFIALGNTPLRAVRRKELSVVVNGVLRRHPALHYYQGYHDVVSVLLSVMIPRTRVSDADVDVDNDALAAVIDVAGRVSMHFLRDNMTTDMTPTMGHLKVLRDILRQRAPTLARRVEQAAPLPYFALPWLLSLMAHDVVDPDIASAIFDYVLARGPLSMLCVSAALIERGLSEAEDSDDSDAAEMHHSLSQLPLSITLDNLPDILRVAEDVATERDNGLDNTVMGDDSVLHTWSALPRLTAHTAWNEADARADAILRGHTTSIVINALPTPPASDAGDDGAALAGHADRNVEKDAALVLRRWWRRPSKRRAADPAATPSALLAWVGAVGALSAALIILYGHSSTASTSGLGSAFPVGLRAAEPLRAMLRHALPH